MASKKVKKSKKAKGQADTSPLKDQLDTDEGEDAADRGVVTDSEGEAGDEQPEPSDKPPRASKPPRSKPSREDGKSTGVLAVFDHPDTTLEAAKKARDRGFERWDVYTPFPVHGMDDAMGLGRSPVPWITFTMGVMGFCAAIIIQFGTMVYSWPINYGGKPFAAWPSFVPITFEMTVLMAGVSTAIGSLLLGGVLKLRKRKPHPHVTSHRFAIFVEASDPKYDEPATLAMFEKAGAVEVRAVKEGE